MASGYTFLCNKCKYSFETSGPYEFFRDVNGNLFHYGHPGPVSEEAEQYGICGFYGRLYCCQCDMVVNALLMEFVKGLGYFAAWTTWYKSGDIASVKCPLCNTTNMVLDPLRDRTVNCLRCGSGVIYGKKDWSS